jgi:hypothetical protein
MRSRFCVATDKDDAPHQHPFFAMETGTFAPKRRTSPCSPSLASRRATLGGQHQQELDLVSMFKDVAGAYVAQASSPAKVRHLVDRAARIALSRRTVTAIILPNDLQDEAYEDPPTAIWITPRNWRDRR